MAVGTEKVENKISPVAAVFSQYVLVNTIAHAQYRLRMSMISACLVE